MKWLIVLLTLLFAVNANAQDAILGNWVTSKKNAKVQIYSDHGKYFGKIVWLKEPNGEDGKPKLDKNNPDDKLKNQAILGLNILSNFIYDGDNRWTDGKVYDPQNGKYYSCKMKINDEKKLEIRGYIGISLFGRTEIWERAE